MVDDSFAGLQAIVNRHFSLLIVGLTYKKNKRSSKNGTDRILVHFCPAPSAKQLRENFGENFTIN